MSIPLSNHTFTGQWITSPELAELPVHNVFQRQPASTASTKPARLESLESP